ncbi:MAG: hypothetical protein ACPGVN_08645 [Alphaproteobacteria bacterium]
MMDTMNLFFEAGNYFDPKLNYWLFWMQCMLFFAPILLIYFKAARIQLLAMIGTLVLALMIFWYDDYTVTKLLGASHITWVVSLFYMVEAVKSKRWIVYRAWAGLAAITICISFVFDAYEVAQYLMGNHDSVLIGVPVESPLYRP